MRFGFWLSVSLFIVFYLKLYKLVYQARKCNAIKHLAAQKREKGGAEREKGGSKARKRRLLSEKKAVTSREIG